MNAILACSDGSLYAASVYQHAAWAARRMGTSVHVEHLLRDPQAGSPLRLADLEIAAEVASFQEALDCQALERGRRELTFAGHQLENAGIAGVTLEQQYGDLAAAVSARESETDLVVVGKTGEASSLGTGHLGTNLERVIRSSQRPVLVAARHFSPIESFLLAWDGGESVQQALRYLLEEPLLRGLRCHVIQAGNLTAAALREEAVRSLRAGGFEVTVEVADADPDRAITEAADREGTDLLVMGAYGYARLRSLVVGSTAAAMIRSRERPVLLFHQHSVGRGAAASPIWVEQAA